MGEGRWTRDQGVGTDKDNEVLGMDYKDLFGKDIRMRFVVRIR